LQEAGLVDKFAKEVLPIDNKCSLLRRKTIEESFTRFSPGHLSGAFLILLAGFVWAIVVFIGEKVMSAHYREKVRIFDNFTAEIEKPIVVATNVAKVIASIAGEAVLIELILNKKISIRL